MSVTSITFRDRLLACGHDNVIRFSSSAFGISDIIDMSFFMFACPNICSYHDNAFITSRALHVVNDLNTSATYRLLEAFFGQQVTRLFWYTIYKC